MLEAKEAKGKRMVENSGTASPKYLQTFLVYITNKHHWFGLRYGKRNKGDLIYSVGWESLHFEDMDPGNHAFVGVEKGSEQGCDVGLGLVMQQVEESCSNKSFMAMALHNHDQHSSSSCYVEGFDGGASGGGTIVCNTSNQEPCRGDIYDVVGAAAAAAVVLKSPHHHSFPVDPFAHNFSGEMAAPLNARIPFTAAQWQELERQTMIFKYMMASAPVPAPSELVPITKTPSKGSLELGFSSNSSDSEPWRCRRTDGKKWRCSRDVVPDQKYCERHSHKSRPRSRKPVELPNHSSNINNNDQKSQTLHNMASAGTKQSHQNPHFTSHNDAILFTSSLDQSRCLEWFVKGETTVPFAGNSSTEWHLFNAPGTNYDGNASEHHQLHYKDHRLSSQAQHLNEQFSPRASLGGPLNQTHSQETRAFIDAWSTADREVEMDGIGSKRHVYSNEKLPLSSLTLSMWGGNENNQEEEDEDSHEMGAFGFMGSATENVRALRPSQMMDPISWTGSSPGGPLAEALCLGIATSQTTSTSSCSKST